MEFNRLPFVIVSLLVFMASPARGGAPISWNNASGGNWGDAANWNPQQVPVAGDDVLITLAGTYTVTLNANASVNSLTLGDSAGTQTLSNPNRTLTLASASSVQGSGVFIMAGGTLDGNGNLTVSGILEWRGGTMAEGASTNILSGAMLELAGTTKTHRRVINNAGTTTWTAGSINSGAGAEFNNQTGATFTIDSDLNYAYNLGGTRTEFNNAAGATLTKEGGNGTTTFSALEFNSDGTVNVDSGVLRITSSGSGTYTGTFNSAAGSRVEFSGGIHTMNMGANFAGAGTPRLTAGTLMIAADTNAVSFEITAGTIDGDGTFTVSSVLHWMGGTMTGNGTTEIPENATLELAGTTKTHRRIIDNAGTTTWTAGSINSGAGAEFNNQAGATFTIDSDLNYAYNLGGTRTEFNNAAGATLTKEGGNGTTTFSALEFNSDGTVNVDSGVLRITSSGSGTYTGTFNSAAGSRVEFSGGIHTMNMGANFAGAGTPRLTAGTLMIAADTNAVSFEITAGTIDGDGTFTVSSVLHWMGGTMTGNGTTEIPENATLELAGTTKTHRRIINNAGTTTWTAGSINSGFGAEFNNMDGATFTIDSDLNYAYNLGGTRTEFNNAAGATLTKEGGNGTTTFSALEFNSDGTVNVDSGVLRMTSSGSGTYTGTFNSAAGSRVEFSGGIHTMNMGANFAGAGTPRLTAGTLMIAADTNAVSFEITAGTIDGDGTFTVSSVLHWMGGTMTGNGTTEIPENATLELAGTTKTHRRIIDNAGTTTWTAGSINSGAGAEFNNMDGATFTIDSDLNYAYNLGGTRTEFNNAAGATLTKEGGNGTTTFSALAFNNMGMVSAEAGTMRFVSFDYVQTSGSTLLAGGSLSTNGTFDIQGGVLGGSGSITGNVSQGGQTNVGASAGMIDITGNYTQTSTGAFNVEIGGLAAGTQFDLLTVSGTAALGGACNLSLINGFTPSLGNTFQVMTFGTRTGEFDSIGGIGIGGGLNFQKDLSDLDLVARVVAGNAPTSTPAGTTPMATPTASSTATQTLTSTPSFTATESPTSAPGTPTSTVLASPTSMATATPTETPTDAPGTATSTPTSTPTDTVTSTPTSTATSTPTSVSTPTPSPTGMPDRIKVTGKLLAPGRTGPQGPRGLAAVPGNVVELFSCDTRRVCLRNPGEPIDDTLTDETGTYTFFVPADFLPRRILLIVRAFVDGAECRFLITTDRLAAFAGLGVAAGGGSGLAGDADPLDSITESAVRLLEIEGLENYNDAGIDAVFEVVEAANADTNFADLTVAQANDLAETTAEEDPAVQVVLEEAQVGVCTGDCNGNRIVTISELITGVNIALGLRPLEECPAFDADGDGRVTVSEAIEAVLNALEGCD